MTSQAPSQPSASGRAGRQLFIDWHLSADGDGCDVILDCYERYGHVPALIITGFICDDIVNLAYDLDAELVSKPVGEATVTRFARRAAAGSANMTADVRRLVWEWAAQYDLTRKEARLFRVRLSGTSRADLPEVLGVDESTVTTHVKHLIHKTGDPSLEHAVERALRELVEKSFKSCKISPLGGTKYVERRAFVGLVDCRCVAVGVTMNADARGPSSGNR